MKIWILWGGDDIAEFYGVIVINAAAKAKT